MKGLGRVAVLAASLVAVVAGCGSPGNAPESARFAPYVDATVTADPFVAMADQTGVTNVVLAFILATDGACEPSWGGVRPLADPALIGAVEHLRETGEITVATGGADGPYLETTCGSAADLRAAYETALDAVGADRLDVDIEADVPVPTVVEALAELQGSRGTAITLTLRVHDQSTGLEPAAVELVEAADERGLDVTVNAMVMNFPPIGGWREAMIDATGAVLRQLAAVWPDLDDGEVARRTGVTLMIGRTDLGEITTPEDARTVASTARDAGLGHLGFWSVGRDNGSCPGRTAVAVDCSGIAQPPFLFTETMRDAFAPGGG